MRHICTTRTRCCHSRATAHPATLPLTPTAHWLPTPHYGCARGTALLEGFLPWHSMALNSTSCSKHRYRRKARRRGICRAPLPAFSHTYTAVRAPLLLPPALRARTRARPLSPLPTAGYTCGSYGSHCGSRDTATVLLPRLPARYRSALCDAVGARDRVLYMRATLPLRLPQP